MLVMSALLFMLDSRIVTCSEEDRSENVENLKRNAVLESNDVMEWSEYARAKKEVLGTEVELYSKRSSDDLDGFSDLEVMNGEGIDKRHYRHPVNYNDNVIYSLQQKVEYCYRLMGWTLTLTKPRWRLFPLFDDRRRTYGFMYDQNSQIVMTLQQDLQKCQTVGERS